MHPGLNEPRARSCQAWGACRGDLQCCPSRRHGRIGLEQGGCDVRTAPKVNRLSKMYEGEYFSTPAYLMCR